MPSGNIYVGKVRKKDDLGKVIEEEKIIEEIPAAPIKFLVFEGGGVRGSAYVGVLDVLYKAGILQSVEHLAGASIGALTAMMSAIGYTPSEINKKLCETNFVDFLESPKHYYYTPNVYRVVKKYSPVVWGKNNSVSSGTVLHKWLQGIVEEKLGTPQATFNDLAKRVTENKGNCKYLSVAVTNLSKKESEIFNHLTKPNIPIALAVLMSCAFPSVFKTVTWENAQYTDAGVTNNLPADMFNTEEYFRDGYDVTPYYSANPCVLCVKIDTAEEMNLLWNNGKIKYYFGMDFAKAIITSLQSINTKVKTQYALNVIQIFDHDIDTLKFDLTQKDKEILISAGDDAATEWVENHFSELYKVIYYDNEEQWLGSKNKAELAAINNAYKKMYAEMLQSEDKESIRLEQLKNKINCLENRLKGIYVECGEHIDLRCQAPRAFSDAIIQKKLREKLAIAENEIQHLETLCKEVSTKIHFNGMVHNDSFIDIVYLAHLKNNLKLHIKIQHDLQNKLNIKFVSHGLTPSAAQAYEEFHADVLKWSSVGLFSKLIVSINFYLENMKAKFNGECGHNLDLDLKDMADLKLFAMAVFLYLKHLPYDFTKNGKLITEVELFYTCLFGTNQLPTSVAELRQFLKINEVDGVVAAFNIETILKNLMQLVIPNEVNGINIDSLFHCSRLFGVQSTVTNRNDDPYKKDISGCEMTFFHRRPLEEVLVKKSLLREIDTKEYLFVNGHPYLEKEEPEKRSQLPRERF